MRNGEKIETFLRTDATKEKLMQAMVGIDSQYSSGESQYV
jgi:hypothetical protein